MQPNFTPAAGRPCSPSSNLPPQLQPDLSFLPLLHHLAPRSPASPRDCLPGTVITACRRRRLAKKATALSPSSLRSSPRLSTLDPAMRTLLVATPGSHTCTSHILTPVCSPCFGHIVFLELLSLHIYSSLPPGWVVLCSAAGYNLNFVQHRTGLPSWAPCRQPWSTLPLSCPPPTPGILIRRSGTMPWNCPAFSAHDKPCCCISLGKRLCTSTSHPKPAHLQASLT